MGNQNCKKADFKEKVLPRKAELADKFQNPSIRNGSVAPLERADIALSANLMERRLPMQVVKDADREPVRYELDNFADMRPPPTPQRSLLNRGAGEYYKKLVLDPIPVGLRGKIYQKQNDQLTELDPKPAEGR